MPIHSTAAAISALEPPGQLHEYACKWCSWARPCSFVTSCSKCVSLVASTDVLSALGSPAKIPVSFRGRYVSDGLLAGWLILRPDWRCCKTWFSFGRDHGAQRDNESAESEQGGREGPHSSPAEDRHFGADFEYRRECIGEEACGQRDEQLLRRSSRMFQKHVPGGLVCLSSYYGHGNVVVSHRGMFNRHGQYRSRSGHDAGSDILDHSFDKVRSLPFKPPFTLLMPWAVLWQELSNWLWASWQTWLAENSCS